ncbi:MAG TPA: hypothetical protein VGH08_01930 [Chthoniobacterales bacterium]|jgi:hypothetical protein
MSADFSNETSAVADRRYSTETLPAHYFNSPPPVLWLVAGFILALLRPIGVEGQASEAQPSGGKIMKLFKLESVVFLAAVLTLTAASPTPSARPEDMLKSAGFQTMRAENDAQKKQVKALPDRKICAVKQNGKRYYVYADKKHNQLYVGNEEKHKRFRSALKPGTNGDAIKNTVYDNTGNAVRVDDFHGFGPFAE